MNVRLIVNAQDMLAMLHRLTDNYERSFDCACDRCNATEDAKKLIARIEGDPMKAKGSTG